MNFTVFKSIINLQITKVISCNSYQYTVKVNLKLLIDE